MHVLRALLHRHRLLAMLLVVCALAIKAAVPAGYMLGQQGKVLTVVICADASGGTVTQQMVVPMTGEHDAAGKHDAASKAETCPYAALGFAALGGADMALLALALAFILAIGLMPAPIPPLRRRSYIQPPLRGPPALV